MGTPKPDGFIPVPRDGAAIRMQSAKTVLTKGIADGEEMERWASAWDGAAGITASDGRWVSDAVP